MRLRRRLALLFVVTPSVMIAVAFVVTWQAFRHAQERQLDHALLARAHHRAQLVARDGEQALAQETLPEAPATDLDELVQYSAIYRVDGSVVAATENLGIPPPSLQLLGFLKYANAAIPREQAGLEFSIRGNVLRGVLVHVDLDRGPGQRLLLLAASRSDIDTDTWYLVRLMAAVWVGATACALVIGWWLGGYLSRSIEVISATARRVGQGHLSERVPNTKDMAESEIRSLAEDLNDMIDQLSRLLDLSRRFVSHAAHELRSPLAALRGELELALHRPRSLEEYRAAIREALGDTERLISLAEDLLTLARLESATRRCEGSSFPLQAAFDDALRDSAAAHSSTVRIDASFLDLQIVGHRADIRRLLRNLLDNAVRHSPQDGVITVRATRRSPVPDVKAAPAQEVVLTVEDQGPGVPSELREKIFEPFFRGEKEREDSGAGLGLCIAREIVRAHGGTLTCEAGPHGGARFVVTLRGNESFAQRRTRANGEDEGGN